MEDALIRKVVKKLEDDLFATMVGPRYTLRPTILRYVGGRFESVPLDNDGKIIERCQKCGPILLCSECMARVG